MLTKFYSIKVSILYPKKSSREEHYAKLVTQAKDVGVKFIDTMPKEDKADIIVDAIFGFSFKGEPREPFASIIEDMIQMQNDFGTTIISVDVPSGWNVDEGDVARLGLNPDVLISLTAPKLCAKEFDGVHFVGGRFLPPHVAEKFGVKVSNV